MKKDNMEENNLPNQQPNQEVAPQRPANKLLDKLKPFYQKIDSKFVKIIPDQKIRKVAILSLLGFAGFFIFILLLGILASLSQPRVDPGYTLNKPSITQTSPVPDKPKTKMQEELMNLKQQINDIKFPPSELTTPQIETKIEIK